METTVAILVMLNNYMHDLATAVFGVSAFAAWVLVRKLTRHDALEPLRPVVRALLRLGVGAFVWILIFGAVRGATYGKYEWVDEAGTVQVTVLAVKHVILVAMTVLGIAALLRARALFRADGRLSRTT